MAEKKYVVFSLANEAYAVPIEAVERILPDQRVTRLPKTPDMFLGVFDLRGETVPAVSLRQRFGMVEKTGDCNFVVILTAMGRCAVRVDGVDGIVAIPDESVEQDLDLIRTRDDDFIKGVGKHDEQLIVLLETNNVIPANLRRQMDHAASVAVAPAMAA